jgi:hypothetical protein
MVYCFTKNLATLFTVVMSRLELTAVQMLTKVLKL